MEGTAKQMTATNSKENSETQTMKLRPKLSILLPVRNEGTNLKFMLKILEATVDMPHETIVVYDSLEDDSIPVVTDVQTRYPQILSIHNKLGRGVLNAVRAGIQAASSEHILIIAADDLGPLLAIDDMKKLMDSGCDLVSATRYSHGGRVLGGSFIGSKLSRLANLLSHWMLGVAFSDSTVGIKMFRRSLFDEIKLEAKPIGFAFAYEISLKAQYAGMKLGEVPIISINRFYGGKSSFKMYSWIKEYTRWFLWGLKHLHTSKKRNDVVIWSPPTAIQ